MMTWELMCSSVPTWHFLAQLISVQNFPYMTREDFFSHLKLEKDEDRQLHPRNHRGVNKVWQVIGEKHREYQMFGFVGGWHKKWYIICQCIDKDGAYQTKKFESDAGNDVMIEPNWDHQIRQWIFKHTGDTFAADGNNIALSLPQSLKLRYACINRPY